METKMHRTLPIEVAAISVEHIKASSKQIRGIIKKYPGSEQVCRKYRQLSAILGSPIWKMEYFPSGVIAITLTTAGKYDRIAIYVRENEYEVRLSDGFMRGRNPREVKEYLERKIV